MSHGFGQKNAYFLVQLMKPCPVIHLPVCLTEARYEVQNRCGMASDTIVLSLMKSGGRRVG